MSSFLWPHDNTQWGESPLRKLYTVWARGELLGKYAMAHHDIDLHGIPLETLIAVATHAMPLDVFADWLEDHDHPWFSFVRTIAECDDAYHEVRLVTRKELAQARDGWESTQTQKRLRQLSQLYPFARAIDWKAVERDSVLYLTLFADTRGLLAYITSIVRSVQPGLWHLTTAHHIPVLIPFHAHDHLP